MRFASTCATHKIRTNHAKQNIILDERVRIRIATSLVRDPRPVVSARYELRDSLRHVPMFLVVVRLLRLVPPVLCHAGAGTWNKKNCSYGTNTEFYAISG